MRSTDRRPDQLRPVILETGVNRYADGSCLIRIGETQVLCTAAVEESIPRFLRNRGRGWIDAEYGMLPHATHTRNARTKSANGGRTQEIQRLIGRALRAVTRLDSFGQRWVHVDCDVLQADGGTRAAAITGGFVALALAFRRLRRDGRIKSMPLTTYLAAVSCGLRHGFPLLDLEYDEDADADADVTFALTESGAIVEIQGAAERGPLSRDSFSTLLDLAEKGVATLIEAQKVALERA